MNSMELIKVLAQLNLSMSIRMTFQGKEVSSLQNLKLIQIEQTTELLSFVFERQISHKAKLMKTSNKNSV